MMWNLCAWWEIAFAIFDCTMIIDTTGGGHAFVCLHKISHVIFFSLHRMQFQPRPKCWNEKVQPSFKARLSEARCCCYGEVLSSFTSIFALTFSIGSVFNEILLVFQRRRTTSKSIFNWYVRDSVIVLQLFSSSTLDRVTLSNFWGLKCLKKICMSAYEQETQNNIPAAFHSFYTFANALPCGVCTPILLWFRLYTKLFF